ncbi:MAG: hypothetical protein UU73_C0002G0174 [Candidatus Daviesbacteria bacterium GW2011_GWA1_41_61]|uniref:Uncharacterized protein n=1 Tax=Candidatus Daviesbacteria bacterium GW2011_GWA2_40_9 TaxID=1618424 RepID=A0A0G0X737_9BACT|nr:MAG: hypothetical protein UU26_C0009G0027 [Candidatus Daviesbacteria bacterium GW2011_GWC1_40_9]KKR83452.1 MAG: hypothetical protein UU29_C0005G0033 [Candidatus Daviesbacteria bacterium GW2011_GWA2_40_9]KKR93834.1 MAG: hypothetical protein UU44_C0001G0174 [Candidatus Daviesbacteria bacterium GW2011_GWB1_41_15]KKS15300.1 MAG: hypothetical protein UU73_C0002G0174 [Candidatus Daviesbacteria bacterium GW2011_GWA1_41_61]
MSGRQFLYILIATLITVLIWVASDIIHTRTQSDISPQVQEVLEPVNPNFDQEVINSLSL